MADVELGNLYELNKQVMAQLPPQSEAIMNHNGTVIGDGFGKDENRGFMLMCKERSDFTLFHIIDNHFTEGIEELKEVLQGRGQILAIQYQHGEDAFEIGVKNKEEVYMFMLFSAGGMVIEI